MSSTSYAKVSPSRVRLPEESDRGRISRSLNAAVDLSLAIDSTVSYLGTSQEYAVDQILKQEVDSVILDDTYLLVYSVGSPWYSRETVVSEDMVLRLSPGSHFSVVTDFLDDLANEHDASVILTGGALSRSSRAITRLYERAGYTLEGIPHLTKRRR